MGSRLILIIAIPLLIILFSWWFFSGDQEATDKVIDQPTVQPLDIPSQSDTETKQLAGSALENKTVKDSKKENSSVKPESETEPEEQISDLNEKPESISLPTLSESDDAFRQDILGLSSGFSPWMNTKNIIKQWIIAANDFSQNLRLHKHFRHFKLTQPFQVATHDSGLYISEQSYQRYNALASAVHTVDVKSALNLYEKYRPLLQQVFEQFAYPEQYKLEDIIKKAGSNILLAPILESKVRVIKPSVYYKFADQKLETLSPVQKQMIRMGPENTRIIQAKLRKFIEGLANR